MTNQVDELVLPLVEERLVVGKREVVTGRVQVRTIVTEEPSEARASLIHRRVEIERLAIGEEVLAVPPVREEGDTTIVPVVREEIVITKRLILVEEIRMRRVTTVEDHVETVILKSQHAEVYRALPEPLPANQTTSQEKLL